MKWFELSTGKGSVKRHSCIVSKAHTSWEFGRPPDKTSLARQSPVIPKRGWGSLHPQTVLELQEQAATGRNLAAASLQGKQIKGNYHLQTINWRKHLMSMPRPRLVPNQLNSITINKPLKWIPANSYREKKKQQINPLKQKNSQTRQKVEAAAKWVQPKVTWKAALKTQKSTGASQSTTSVMLYKPFFSLLGFYYCSSGRQVFPKQIFSFRTALLRWIMNNSKRKHIWSFKCTSAAQQLFLLIVSTSEP